LLNNNAREKQGLKGPAFFRGLEEKLYKGCQVQDYVDAEGGMRYAFPADGLQA